MSYYVWMKKFGPKHLYTSGDNETLCGKPMLGNNYHTFREEEGECEECYNTARALEAEEQDREEEESLTETDFTEKGSHAMACDFDRIMKKAVTVRNRLSPKFSDLFLKQLSQQFGDLEELINDWGKVVDLPYNS